MVIDAIREELAHLSWAERFERLFAIDKASTPAERPAVRRLREELAVDALIELSPSWNGMPFKKAIRQLDSKKLRTALGLAVRRTRDRYIGDVVEHGRAPLRGTRPDGRVGVGMDERVLEIPLALEAARLHEPGSVLDAGAALNVPVVRELVGHPAAQLTHFTLPGGREPFLPGSEQHFVYAFGDLRAIPYPDGAFDRVVSISTLEHVGMDNTRYGASVEHVPGSATDAVAEMWRVLTPGGELLVTVPYGRAVEHGWFRVFDAESLGALLDPVGSNVELRHFYYDRGWVEGGATPPSHLLDADFSSEVIAGLAVARMRKPIGALAIRQGDA